MVGDVILEGPELNFTKTNYQTYSAEKYGDVIAKYEIENGVCNYTKLLINSMENDLIQEKRNQWKLSVLKNLQNIVNRLEKIHYFLPLLKNTF